MAPDLHDQILDAHAQGDHAILVTLYSAAADESADIDEKCFFLTHAYIFALELGDTRSTALYGQLQQYGRE